MRQLRQRRKKTQAAKRVGERKDNAKRLQTVWSAQPFKREPFWVVSISFAHLARPVLLTVLQAMHVTHPSMSAPLESGLTP